MAASTEVRTGGVSTFTLLGLLFIGLKLGSVIDWSWWWVLAPFWAPAAAFLTFLVVVGLVMVALALVSR